MPSSPYLTPLSLVVKLTGLRFSKDAHKKFSGLSKWNYKEPLDLLDLTDMGDRVKDMDIVSISQVRMERVGEREMCERGCWVSVNFDFDVFCVC